MTPNHPIGRFPHCPVCDQVHSSCKNRDCNNATQCAPGDPRNPLPYCPTCKPLPVIKRPSPFTTIAHASRLLHHFTWIDPESPRYAELVTVKANLDALLADMDPE